MSYSCVRKAAFVTAIAVSELSGTIPVSGALNTAPAIALRKIV
jgi:hypothetical protein